RDVALDAYGPVAATEAEPLDDLGLRRERVVRADPVAAHPRLLDLELDLVERAKCCVRRAGRPYRKLDGPRTGEDREPHRLRRRPDDRPVRRRERDTEPAS